MNACTFTTLLPASPTHNCNDDIDLKVKMQVGTAPQGTP